MTAAYERIGAGHIKTADEMTESRKRVRGFWHHCDQARGTPAAKYLASRGLSWLIRSESVRYRADCPHPSGKRLPAMVALVWDGNGDISALHRTYLTGAGYKADIEPNRVDGPDTWPIARRALRWARLILIHGGPGDASHYEFAVELAKRYRRLVMVECSSTNIAAWERSASKWCAGAEGLVMRPPPGGVHPVPVKMDELH